MPEGPLRLQSAQAEPPPPPPADPPDDNEEEPPAPDNLPRPAEYTGMNAIFRQISGGGTPGPRATMKYELLRLCTLRNYPRVGKPYLIRIAGAGFYYAADGDEVVCYCCGIRKNNWEPDDVPEEVHRRLSPNCSFWTRNSEVNHAVPRDVPGPRTSFDEKFDFIMENVAPTFSSDDWGEDVSNDELPRSSRRCQHPAPVTAARNQSIPTPPENPPPLNQPKHPHYFVKATRLRSYLGFQNNGQQDIDRMATAGFYFAGIGDCVRCFHCGVGLRQWAAEDDPFIEHARWSQTCAYLIQYKGQEFVDLVHQAIRISQDESPSAPGSQPNEETTGVLTTDAAQSVLEMGYDATIIRRAINEILVNIGREGVLTAALILEKVIHLEELDERTARAERRDAESKAAPASSEAPPPPQSADESTRESSSSPSPSPSSPDDESGSGDSAPDDAPLTRSQKKRNRRKAAQESAAARKEATRLKNENEKLKERTTCTICLDRQVSVVFLPCGHLVACAVCAPQLRVCPICRALVKGTVKTYIG